MSTTEQSLAEQNYEIVEHLAIAISKTEIGIPFSTIEARLAEASSTLPGPLLISSAYLIAAGH